MEGTSQPLCVPSTLILVTLPPPAFLGKRSGSRIKQNWVGSGSNPCILCDLRQVLYLSESSCFIQKVGQW